METLIIWLRLLPARCQILERESCRVSCPVSRVTCLWVVRVVQAFELSGVLQRSTAVSEFLSCPASHFHFNRDVSSFLTEVLWTVCQTQYAHKDTESDSCRLQVCSFYHYWVRVKVRFLACSIRYKGLGFAKCSKCLCVCNQWAYTDDSADTVDQLLSYETFEIRMSHFFHVSTFPKHYESMIRQTHQIHLSNPFL